MQNRGKMMDILLVNGVDYQLKITNPQIGQLILRDILKVKYDVECINFDYLAKKKKIRFKENIWDNIDMFAEYLISKSPQIIGFYTICNSFLTTLLLAKQIKLKKPEVKIVFGGPHATLTARECLEDFAFVDVISLWEGEKTILPLMDALMGGHKLDELKGIAYRRAGEVIMKDRADLLQNEELAKYTPFDYTPVEITSKTAIELEAGRGCPFACTFCSTSPFWGRKFRIKSVDELIGEMVEFHRLYGIIEFSLVHDMFTANKSHLLNFCNRIIQDKLPFRWGCSSRVDVLNKETLELMKKANCSSIYLGIETGSASMQKKINKNLNLDHALAMILEIDRLGMEFTTSFIYGYPEETVEEFQETIQMMEKIILTGNRNVQLHRFMLLPHTEETDRVFHEAYFDETDVDFSIYDEKLYDENAKKIIRNYPREFIQFYTFQSEVREKYRLFDSFEYYVVCAMAIYNCSVRYLIRRHGLEKLYIKYLDLVEQVYINLRKMNIEAGSKIDSGMQEIYRFIEAVIDNELKCDYSDELEQLRNFEALLRQYSESKDKTPKYYHVSFDIIKERKESVYSKKSCVVKFYYENDKLRVAKVKIEKSKVG